MLKSLSADILFQQHPEIYKAGDQVYLRVPRGVDPNPYRIYKCLGDGKYELYRNKRIEAGYFEQGSLQTRAP